LQGLNISLLLPALQGYSDTFKYSIINVLLYHDGLNLRKKVSILLDLDENGFGLFPNTNQ